MGKLQTAEGTGVTAALGKIPNDAPQGTQTLDDFIGGTDVVVAVSGYTQSTEIESLIAAFWQSLNTSASLPALKTNLIHSSSLTGLNFPPFVAKVNAYVDIGTALATSTISVDFDISNPLDTEIEIEFAQADPGLDGETYVHFEHALNNFAVPPHSTANSGAINNVRLTQGTLGLIGLLGAKTVDVFTVATVKIGVYTVPWLHLTALDVLIHRNP
ncbi:hypothetical protein LXA43DRAFT_1096881 [Ganoderma leucocontextum]|nr:hypothetical protein LXA43DRAFT_1096881 [Ganoderma leucocontextum]